MTTETLPYQFDGRNSEYNYYYYIVFDNKCVLCALERIKQKRAKIIDDKALNNVFYDDT